MTDLSLVSTDDMLDELKSRHDAMIFAAYQNRTLKESRYFRRWDGGNIPCLGLSRFIQKRIEEACDEMDRYTNDPDKEISGA